MIADTKNLNKKIADKIIFLLKTEKHGEEMKQKVLYSLQVILSEVEKLLIFLFVFAVCNLLQEFLISYIALVSIRIYVGGNHCKTSMGCIIYSIE